MNIRSLKAKMAKKKCVKNNIIKKRVNTQFFVWNYNVTIICLLYRLYVFYVNDLKMNYKNEESMNFKRLFVL